MLIKCINLYGLIFGNFQFIAWPG